MSIHLYSRSSNTYEIVNTIRAGMAAYGMDDHPIWLTETGVPLWGDAPAYNAKYDYAATRDEAAAYVIQSYANAWAADVERYFFFRASDDAAQGEYFGLIRDDESLRPAYVAYQVAATYLVTPTFVTRTPDDPVMHVALWGTPQGKVSVLWNESPSTAVYTMPAAVDTATVVDRFGVTSTLGSAGGNYVFALEGATANLVSNSSDYIIGGDPIIVVESESPNEPPTSTVEAIPTTTYTSTFTVSWHGSDNESGIGTYDVQVRDGAGGAWQDWQQMTTGTDAQFVGEHGHTYYFRSRATDKVGNRETWPAQPQASTTIDLARTFHFSVDTYFADDDRDSVFEPPQEVTLTGVTLRLLDEGGQDVIAPTTSREFTATIYAGQTYLVLMTVDDYIQGLSFGWPWYEMTHDETYSELPLWPVMRMYLPRAAQDAGG
jgi:hypothetical protein